MVAPSFGVNRLTVGVAITAIALNASAKTITKKIIILDLKTKLDFIAVELYVFKIAEGFASGKSCLCFFKSHGR